MSKKENKKNEKNHTANECDKIGETAIGYGFTVVTPPTINETDISKTKQFKDYDYYEDAEEKIALARWYDEQNFLSEPQPIMIHYKKPFHGTSYRKKPSEETYGFEIMGSLSSTSEAVLIKTALSILSDLGYKDVFVDINSIGDKESISKFEREIGSYFRKHAHELTAKIRQEFKKNPYSIITNDLAEMREFSQSLPQTISTLSDLSREHFKEVLEYMEAFEVIYKIKQNLLSNKTHASHTIFEIRETSNNSKSSNSQENGTLLAYGYRYNYLAKKIGIKKEIPSVGMTLIVKKNLIKPKKVIIKNIKKPCFYLVQLGGAAKLKALNVVETLRKSKIPTYHSLTKDKIGGQLSGAEYMKASHLIIIGQKEALENTVVVRNAITREQETVSVCDLAIFLKNMEKK